MKTKSKSLSPYALQLLSTLLEARKEIDRQFPKDCLKGGAQESERKGALVAYSAVARNFSYQCSALESEQNAFYSAAMKA